MQHRCFINRWSASNCTTVVWCKCRSISNHRFFCGPQAWTRLVVIGTSDLVKSIAIRNGVCAHSKIYMLPIVSYFGDKLNGIEPNEFQHRRVYCNIISIHVVWSAVLTMMHSKIPWAIRLAWKVHVRLQIWIMALALQLQMVYNPSHIHRCRSIRVHLLPQAMWAVLMHRWLAAQRYNNKHALPITLSSALQAKMGHYLHSGSDCFCCRLWFKATTSTAHAFY